MTTLTTDRPASRPAVSPPPAGWWTPGPTPPTTDPHFIHDAVHDPARPLVFVRTPHGPALAEGGTATLGPDASADDALPLAAIVPAVRPEHLGDPTFHTDHRLRFAYLAGAMANGIGSVEIVEAMSRAGMLGFFGAAGLSIQRIESAIERLQRELGHAPFGINLIHSPGEPDHEAATVDLLLRRDVRLVEASAYLDLTLPVVRYRVAGIRRGPNGEIIAPNHVIAKVSRVEVATKFFSPPPEKLLARIGRPWRHNRRTGGPGEADSSRPGRDRGGRLRRSHRQPAARRFGADVARAPRSDAGPARLPDAAAGRCGGWHLDAGERRRGVRDGRGLRPHRLSQPGVRRERIVRRSPQDARRGRAGRRHHGPGRRYVRDGRQGASAEARNAVRHAGGEAVRALPDSAEPGSDAHGRARPVGKELFRAPLEEIWNETRSFWQSRDPKQVERAERDAKHKMALVFRWYLGLSSRWANAGEPTRQVDYQVWCGPAMGAFNEWTKGSFLERPENRRVVTVAKNLLHGAAGW